MNCPTFEELLSALEGESPGEAVAAHLAAGCPTCSHSGYRGRVGIFELMLVDDSIRNMVSSSIDAKTIKHNAVSNGMSTLRSDGARKVLSGVTSIAEVLRATEEEGAVAQI